jgi:RND family efflux transporter MFP subunit
VVQRDDLSELRIQRPSAGARRRSVITIPRVLAVVFIFLALAVGAAWLLRGGAPVVRTAQAQLRGGSAGGPGLTANGYVVARTKASISSKLPGRLARLTVEEGDEVRAGQVIAWLESAEYDAAVRGARSDVLNAEAAEIEAAAKVEQADRNLARARQLFADSLTAMQNVQDAETVAATSAAQLRAAQARVQAARAMVAATEANLENTRIRAPFDGTVLRKDAEVGEVVAPAVAGGGLTRGAVVTMADLSTLEVEVDINESYIGGVDRGQPATIVLDAYPTVQFAAHVRQILPTADRQKATVLVRVAFDSTDARVLPEMGGRVEFLTVPNDAAADATPRVFVSADAIRNDGGRDVVWIVSDERVTRREVDAGPVSGGEREVRSGLRGGETLVIDPPASLADGVRVKVEQN